MTSNEAGETLAYYIRKIDDDRRASEAARSCEDPYDRVRYMGNISKDYDHHRKMFLNTVSDFLYACDKEVRNHPDQPRTSRVDPQPELELKP